MALAYVTIRLLIVDELQDWTHETPRDVSLYIFPSENSTLIYPQKLEKYSQSHLDVLVLVTSDPTRLDRRNAIRKTWGKLDNSLGVKMSLVFLMGLSANPQVESKQDHTLALGQISHSERSSQIKIDWPFKKAWACTKKT